MKWMDSMTKLTEKELERVEKQLRDAYRRGFQDACETVKDKAELTCDDIVGDDLSWMYYQQ